MYCSHDAIHRPLMSVCDCFKCGLFCAEVSNLDQLCRFTLFTLPFFFSHASVLLPVSRAYREQRQKRQANVETPFATCDRDLRSRPCHSPFHTQVSTVGLWTLGRCKALYYCCSDCPHVAPHMAIFSFVSRVFSSLVLSPSWLNTEF
jgi:hypothetical protein